jgi:KaiC/GvpD/RAD55 family RecA-like ATPase
MNDTSVPTDTDVSSGIQGLDALLAGGLTPRRMYLVEGLPGTGKTTLAMQIPQVEASLVRMHELLSFLDDRGVAALIVVAQHGIVGTHMATPLDVSYLADSVVLLRFFESHGKVRRALSVMKKRSGAHEQTIREFQIGPDRYMSERHSLNSRVS